MKAYDEGMDIFTTSALVGGTHWIGGLTGPRTGLEYVERRNILPLPRLELRPLGRPARSQHLIGTIKIRRHYGQNSEYSIS
jgi:hypothetical protein